MTKRSLSHSAAWSERHHGDTNRSVPRVARPYPASHGMANSHDHVEVVPTPGRQLGDFHAAQSAHGVRIGALGITDRCEHYRIARGAKRKAALGFLVTPITHVSLSEAYRFGARRSIEAAPKACHGALRL